MINRILWMAMALFCQRPHPCQQITVWESRNWDEAHPELTPATQ
jgi:hypothetical protein